MYKIVSSIIVSIVLTLPAIASQQVVNESLEIKLQGLSFS
ncbi:MAG: energy-converting hydrogenase Eha subunit A [Alteromonadaceae bacterium]|jgi:energy-converting hydrogenase Eha subunit A